MTVMALMTLLSWRGLDAMAHTLESYRARTNAVQQLQTALIQWRTDLDAAGNYSGQLQAMEWNGQTLRLTRAGLNDQGAPVIYVVAWQLRTTSAEAAGVPPPSARHWVRWQSPALTTRAQWKQAWQSALGSDQSAPFGLVLFPVRDWNVSFGQAGNVWDLPRQPDDMGLPEALRLILTLPEGYGLTDTITSDWVRPTLVMQRR